MAAVSGLKISRPQSNSSTCSEESRSRLSSNSPSRRRRASSKLPLIEEHHGPVGPSLPVGEAGALVEPARRFIALAGATLHLLGTLGAGGLQWRLPQRPDA